MIIAIIILSVLLLISILVHLKGKGIINVASENLSKAIKNEETIMSTTVKTEKNPERKDAVKIDYFILSGENDKENIKFDFFPITNIETEIKGWKPLPVQSEQISHMLSSIIGGGINVGSVLSQTKGLFKATVDTSTLMQSGGKFLSAVRGTNGKIVQQAGFLPQGGSIATPLVVFQLMSIVTGQYYMNTITKQLNSIVGKLDQLLSYIDSRDKGELETCSDVLRKFALKEIILEEDLHQVQTIKSQISTIRKTYLNECRKFDLKDNDYKSGNYFTDWGRAEHIANKFYEKGYQNKIEILLYAEKLLVFAEQVDLFINIKFCSRNQNDSRMTTIKEKIETFFQTATENLTESQRVSENISSRIISRIKSIESDSIVYEESFINLISKLEKERKQLSNEFRLLSSTIRENQLNIVEPMLAKHEIYIDYRNDEYKMYIK